MTDQMIVHNLTCDSLINPVGIGNISPRLSWKIQSTQDNVIQYAYQIQVFDGNTVLWDTGQVVSDQSIYIAYNGPELNSRQHCRWHVRVWLDDVSVTDWSDEAYWEMGLLHLSDWQAQWIEPEREFNPDEMQPSPFLRCVFDLEDKIISSGRIYATAHGVYELHLNGEIVGDRILAPGWTAYQHRLQYQVYDVTSILMKNTNVVGAIIGDGWWRGAVGPESMRNAWGEKLGFLLQLEINYVDGIQETIITDSSWLTATGPIVKSDPMAGETYDARLELLGWNTTHFDASDWEYVTVAPYPLDNLIAEVSSPIRCQETFKPQAIITTPSKQTVIDFGQNISGRVRFSLSGEAGETITLRHQEALEHDGNFHVETGEAGMLIGIGLPIQADHYTFKGEGIETYEPKFTTHGFRYVLVEGYTGEISEDAFTAVAIYSDITQTGTFECSHPMINQLHSNILWGQKGNFMDVPTDCPTRERAGWTGDAQVFCRTGSTLMDTETFFTKWLNDVTADQDESGRVPGMVPSFYRAAGKSHPIFSGTDGSAGWGDAIIIIPWTLYQIYGDIHILESNYESMKLWFEYVHHNTQNVNWHRKLNPMYWLNPSKRENLRILWDTNFHFGEWLEPGETMPAMLFGVFRSFIFSRPIVASAYYKHICDLMGEITTLLNKTDAINYQGLSQSIKEAYAGEFIGQDGRIQPDKQASYVRALQFDLVPQSVRSKVVGRLVDLIRANDNHLATGFLSTGFLCQILTEEGYLDVAYDVLMQDTIPSWLYPITKGATTIWEGWDTILPDGKGKGVGSHNHYSKGAVGEWMYRVIVGIEIGKPGYKHILISPRPGGGLTSAKGSYESRYGTIISEWHIEQDRFFLHITIPHNTTAEVQLPNNSAPISVGSGHHSFDCLLD